MPPVRIGCVQYLNTLPLIEGLEAWRECELVRAVPSRLIGMLLGGEVDVALVSVIDAAPASHSAAVGTTAPQVTVLPVGMIGCDGPTFTVRVFSRVPIERVRRVAVDTDSHTSATLMRVVFEKVYGVEVEVLEFDARKGAAGKSGSPSASQSLGTSPFGEDLEAVLLIGDKVVTDPPPAERYPYQLDLGAAWKELTGLPFVYAVWMCRAGEEESIKVRAAAAMLDRARRHNRTRMDWLVAARAEEKRWPREAAAKYLGEYMRYEVGAAEREAMGRFFQMAKEQSAKLPKRRA